MILVSHDLGHGNDSHVAHSGVSQLPPSKGRAILLWQSLHFRSSGFAPRLARDQPCRHLAVSLMLCEEFANPVLTCIRILIHVVLIDKLNKLIAIRTDQFIIFIHLAIKFELIIPLYRSIKLVIKLIYQG